MFCFIPLNAFTVYAIIVLISLPFFCKVIYDKVTGRSRGFGFVTMSTVEEVEAAAQQFNGHVS